MRICACEVDEDALIELDRLDNTNSATSVYYTFSLLHVHRKMLSIYWLSSPQGTFENSAWNSSSEMRSVYKKKGSDSSVSCPRGHAMSAGTSAGPHARVRPAQRGGCGPPRTPAGPEVRGVARGALTWKHMRLRWVEDWASASICTSTSTGAFRSSRLSSRIRIGTLSCCCCCHSLVNIPQTASCAHRPRRAPPQ